MSYDHEYTNATASLLEDYASNIIKLADLRWGSNISLNLEFDDLAFPKQVMIYVYRNEKGEYLFNEVPVGDKENAIKTYALICADIAKHVAVQEVNSNLLEDYLKNSNSKEESNVVSSSRISQRVYGTAVVSSSEEDEEIVELFPAEIKNSPIA